MPPAHRNSKSVFGAKFNFELMEAATNGSLKGVKEALDSGANIDTRMEYDWTPLMRACQLGHLDVVKELIYRKADINASNRNGWTCLTAAAYGGRKKIVALLLSKKITVDAEDDMGFTPLIHASYRGHGSVVQLLLDAKADLFHLTKTNTSALILASNESHDHVAEILQKADDKLRVTYEEAVKREEHNKSRLTQLDLYKQDSANTQLTCLGTRELAHSNELLWQSAHKGQLDGVRTAIDAGADLHFQGSHPFNALEAAKRSGNRRCKAYMECCALLLHKPIESWDEADVSVYVEGVLPLHISSHPIKTQLLRHGPITGPVMISPYFHYLVQEKLNLSEEEKSLLIRANISLRYEFLSTVHTVEMIKRYIRKFESLDRDKDMTTIPEIRQFINFVCKNISPSTRAVKGLPTHHLPLLPLLFKGRNTEEDVDGVRFVDRPDIGDEMNSSRNKVNRICDRSSWWTNLQWKYEQCRNGDCTRCTLNIDDMASLSQTCDSSEDAHYLPSQTPIRSPMPATPLSSHPHSAPPLPSVSKSVSSLNLDVSTPHSGQNSEVFFPDTLSKSLSSVKEYDEGERQVDQRVPDHPPFLHALSEPSLNSPSHGRDYPDSSTSSPSATPTPLRSPTSHATPLEPMSITNQSGHSGHGGLVPTHTQVIPNIAANAYVHVLPSAGRSNSNVHHAKDHKKSYKNDDSSCGYSLQHPNTKRNYQLFLPCDGLWSLPTLATTKLVSMQPCSHTHPGFQLKLTDLQLLRIAPYLCYAMWCIYRTKSANGSRLLSVMAKSYDQVTRRHSVTSRPSVVAPSAALLSTSAISLQDLKLPITAKSPRGPRTLIPNNSSYPPTSPSSLSEGVVSSLELALSTQAQPATKTQEKPSSVKILNLFGKNKITKSSKTLLYNLSKLKAVTPSFTVPVSPIVIKAMGAISNLNLVKKLMVSQPIVQLHNRPLSLVPIVVPTSMLPATESFELPEPVQVATVSPSRFKSPAWAALQQKMWDKQLTADKVAAAETAASNGNKDDSEVGIASKLNKVDVNKGRPLSAPTTSYVPSEEKLARMNEKIETIHIPAAPVPTIELPGQLKLTPTSNSPTNNDNDVHQVEDEDEDNKTEEIKASSLSISPRHLTVITVDHDDTENEAVHADHIQVEHTDDVDSDTSTLTVAIPILNMPQTPPPPSPVTPPLSSEDQTAIESTQKIITKMTPRNKAVLHFALNAFKSGARSPRSDGLSSPRSGSNLNGSSSNLGISPIAIGQLSPSNSDLMKMQASWSGSPLVRDDDLHNTKDASPVCGGRARALSLGNDRDDDDDGMVSSALLGACHHLDPISRLHTLPYQSLSSEEKVKREAILKDVELLCYGNAQVIVDEFIRHRSNRPPLETVMGSTENTLNDIVNESTVLWEREIVRCLKAIGLFPAGLDVRNHQQMLKFFSTYNPQPNAPGLIFSDTQFPVPFPSSPPLSPERNNANSDTSTSGGLSTVFMESREALFKLLTKASDGNGKWRPPKHTIGLHRVKNPDLQCDLWMCDRHAKLASTLAPDLYHVLGPRDIHELDEKNHFESPEKNCVLM